MKKPEIIYNINDLTCLTSASDADVISQELLRTNHPDCDKTRQLQGTTLEKSTQKPFNRMTMRQKQDLYTRRMIRFSLKNPAQPLTPIRMRMTINHVRISYALAPTFKIEPKHWDSTEGRAIVDSKRNADLKGNPRLRVRLDTVTTEIDKITNAVLAVLARFQQQGIRASADQVRNELQRELGQEASKARTFRDVFEYIDFYINACREGTILNGTGTRLTPGTIRSYLSTKSALRRYAEARHIRLTLESLTLDFYNDFVKYLNEATHSRGRYRPNVIGKFVKNIRTFLRYAFDNNYTLNSDFKRREFKVFQETVETIYLNEDELQLLYDLELPPSQAEVRDAFLVGCYTGLRFSDIGRLQPHHIRFDEGIIVITTQKTNRTIAVPICPKLRSIFARYDNCPPPTQSNQATNRMLKQLCRKAGITSKVYLTEVLGGERQIRCYEKCDLVTTHTARRSFATNAFKNDIPAALIMSATGHTTEANFRRYIRCTAEEKAVALKQYKFFN